MADRVRRGLGPRPVHGLQHQHRPAALHPSAWCYWQPVDSATWGLVKAEYSNTEKSGELGDVANKYFVLAQYSRHIRPGMEILGTDSQDTVAAYDEDAGQLVIVTVRGGTPTSTVR